MFLRAAVGLVALCSAPVLEQNPKGLHQPVEDRLPSVREQHSVTTSCDFNSPELTISFQFIVKLCCPKHRHWFWILLLHFFLKLLSPHLRILTIYFLFLLSFHLASFSASYSPQHRIWRCFGFTLHYGCTYGSTHCIRDVERYL